MTVPAEQSASTAPTVAAPEAPKPTESAPADVPLSPAEVAELRAAKAQLERMSQEQAKAQAEADRARLAEMAPLEADATRWRAHVAAETKRLDESAAKLPDTFAALYRRATDVDAKREILAAYEAVSAAAPHVAKTPPTSAAPPPKASIDFAAAWASGKWAEAKASDPSGAQAWLDSKSPSRPASASPFARPVPRAQ